MMLWSTLEVMSLIQTPGLESPIRATWLKAFAMIGRRTPSTRTARGACRGITRLIARSRQLLPIGRAEPAGAAGWLAGSHLASTCCRELRSFRNWRWVIRSATHSHVAARHFSASLKDEWLRRYKASERGVQQTGSRWQLARVVAALKTA
jgi:hypothetical protein